MADFLFEIGLEEVPARMIAAAQAELQKRTVALLEREHLLAARATAVSYSTPRRLAVLVKGVLEQQPDITDETTGPAVKIAFKDGVPTPAAEAFARKSGVAVSDLRTIETSKGEYLAATSVKKGRSASAVIADELPKELAGIYWAKNMRWIPGSNEKFVRPIVWMVCLLGDAVVPVSFGGKTAGRASFGHRVLSSGEPFEVQLPESYLAQLEGEYVLADVEVRRQKIRKALDHVTRTIAGARWREDEPLVDAVTHLTEWPDVLLGNFEADYLKLPEEVLVTVMRDHQKYFAVEDASGRLAPHFLTVTNIALDEENAPIIRQGNERVLRARFNDAKFFWEFDQRTPLADRVKLLENVTFQKDLGSYAKKSERVLELCLRLAGLAEARGLRVDQNALMDAARLAKTDLTTELVKEFTELQGAIGGLYFKADAEKDSRLSAQRERVDITWQAIYDQYLPASAKDEIPRNAEGSILGLADRFDTITNMFGLGMEPTGSKDPFALRRAANAIVRILAESAMPLTLTDLFLAANVSNQISGKLNTFFRERIEFYLREVRGNSYDVVAAVMLPGATGLSDAAARADALTRARGSEDFLRVCEAFKRMKNIVTQAAEKGDMPEQGTVEAGSAHPAEVALNTKAGVVGQQVKELAEKLNYDAALEAIATLRPEVDSFFDAVMVMDPNITVRHRRLLMLKRLISTFSGIADFSEIVSS